MLKVSGIYKITCLNNDNFYIGSSVNIHKRWTQHKSALLNNRHCNSILQNIHNKYGIDSFKIEILEICNDKNLIEREQYYLDSLNSCNRIIGGINICDKAEHGKSNCFDDSKEYIIISPDNTRYEIRNLDSFTRQLNFPESSLRSVANGHVFQYKNWHCRKKNVTFKEWFFNNKWYPTNYKNRWKIEFDNNKIIFVDNLNKFCKIYNYSISSLFLLRNNKLPKRKYRDIVKVTENAINIEDYKQWE